MRTARASLAVLACLSLIHCTQDRPQGERLARTYCSACHAFPAPELLDKSTWRAGVLPQMARRLGAGTPLLSDPTPHPHMTVLTEAVSERDWEAIERYYLEQSPDTLPPQRLPAPPQVDPGFFRTGPFVPRAPGAAIITVLETDSTHNRIFVGEAGSRRLLVFDWSRRLLASLALGSPATDVIARDEDVLVLESGILHPNDEPRGRLARYRVGRDSLEFREVLIDSLLRPVFVAQADFDADGRVEFLICEYGDNRGRLALYRERGSGYTRVVLDASPGAIRFEIRDLTADGHPDVVALFAQGDERIVLFVNDGHGGFAEEPRVLARFPPVYGSMHFSMHDFNGDGRRDILYVNGDNFDLSRVLKPYHGIRILENDGNDRFVERYFFPVYGAARAEAADFDRDGDPDIVITSNFADADRHPERGIMFLEHTGPYQFAPYAFSIAARNRWNVMTTGDLNRDGWLDVIVGAMDLESIANIQRRRPPEASDDNNVPLLWFENRMQGRAGAPR